MGQLYFPGDDNEDQHSKGDPNGVGQEVKDVALTSWDEGLVEFVEGPKHEAFSTSG
jgi:hypothetical protein